jgi:hypothetical protein
MRNLHYEVMNTNDIDIMSNAFIQMANHAEALGDQASAESLEVYYEAALRFMNTMLNDGASVVSDETALQVFAAKTEAGALKRLIATINEMGSVTEITVMAPADRVDALAAAVKVLAGSDVNIVTGTTDDGAKDRHVFSVAGVMPARGEEDGLVVVEDGGDGAL